MLEQRNLKLVYCDHIFFQGTVEMPPGILVLHESKLASAHLWIKTHLTLNEHFLSTHVLASGLGYCVYVVLCDPVISSLISEMNLNSSKFNNSSL